MPHLSKKEVGVKTKSDLEQKLFSILLNTTSLERQRLFRELYTPTERMMFAKRIGMIALIERGVGTRTIARLLGVSTSTIRRFEISIEQGAFKNMRLRIKHIASQNWLIKFLGDIGAIPFGSRPKSLVRLLDEM